MNAGIYRERIRLRGLVQGVGMRPLIYRLAQRFGLRGRVGNDAAGVDLRLQGEAEAIDALLQALTSQPPVLARVDAVERAPDAGAEVFSDFRIEAAASTAAGAGWLGDVATCAACVEELFDPAGRRYRYPFIACADCGPRLSIQHAAPWERANTSMRAFPLCARCAAEYADPADRRFHAEPIACPDCGPQCWLSDDEGNVDEAADWLLGAVERLRAGQILAIKALGGFQLLCAADNEQAVQALRTRKRRPAKPLALLVADVAMARAYARLDEAAVQRLSSPRAPIVLLPVAAGAQLATGIAPGMMRVGLMLPSSPLHHLLARTFGAALVCTSGNVSGEPPCTGNAEALRALKGIADAFVLHDREIVTRIDDPVAQFSGRQAQVIRPGRGATCIRLDCAAGFSVLALGAHLKSTIALVHRGQIQLSPHIGDLDGPRCRDEHAALALRYASQCGDALQGLAADAHADYGSRHWAEQFALERALPLNLVQHHHAHAVSVMAEHQLPVEGAPRLAIVLDGLGMSEAGELWGGEFLLADYRNYRRLGHLQSMPLIGGMAAMREPWRNLYAHVHALDWPDALFSVEQRDQLGALDALLRAGLHCPFSTSAGRWFDAVAAALGLAPARLSFEGEAAMRLEAAVCGAALADRKRAYPIEIDDDAALPQLSAGALWPALLRDRKAGVAVGIMAARFHRGLAAALARLALRLIEQHDLPAQVIVSGGVFQNVVLRDLLCEHLHECNIAVLSNRRVPCNDGGIAVGQAACAWARGLPSSE